MKIDYLEEFVELVFNLSYSKAANKLGVSQSSISKHIQLLEKQYKTPIFERNTSSVVLTPFGVELFQESMTLLSAYNNFETRMKDISEKHIKSLVVGGMTYNPRVLQMIKDAQHFAGGESAAPIDFRSFQNTSLAECVASGAVDIGITVDDERLREEGHFEVFPLVEEPLMAIMSKAHPLASRASVTLAELAEHVFVRPCGSYFILANDTIDGIFKSENIRPDERVVFTNQIQDILALDYSNDVSIIEAGMRVSPISNSETCMVPISNESAKLSLVAVCKKANEKALSFIEAIQQSQLCAADQARRG